MIPRNPFSDFNLTSFVMSCGSVSMEENLMITMMVMSCDEFSGSNT